MKKHLRRNLLLLSLAMVATLAAAGASLLPGRASARVAVVMAPRRAVYVAPVRHPVAAAVGTAVVVGATVRALPPHCTAVVVANVAYQQCGSVWYQPHYAGSEVSYVVVNPPR